MHDVTKLPKWAQDTIKDLQSSQNVTGASISGVTVEMCAFKHNPESSAAIVAIANALQENAKALSVLSASIAPDGIDAHFGSAIQLSDIRGK